MDEVPGSGPRAAGGWDEALCWSQGVWGSGGRQHPENLKVSVAQESTAVPAPLSL